MKLCEDKRLMVKTLIISKACAEDKMSESIKQDTCTTVSKKVDTLQDVVDELNKVFAEDRVNVEYVKAVLSAYRSKPKDWKKFAKFDPHRLVVVVFTISPPHSESNPKTVNE